MVISALEDLSMERRFGDTTRIQSCLERMRDGDDSARNALLDRSQRRLRHLARKMLRGFPTVQKWAETDDLLHQVDLRLLKALDEVRPETVTDFMRWAACHIRWELVDLARRYRKLKPSPDGSQLPIEDATSGPATLAQWTEFHEAIQRLPAEQRELFDLLYYCGLTQAEAALQLRVAEITVRRRWRTARLSLANSLRK